MIDNPHIQKASPKAVRYIAENLRPADLKELKALKGPDANPLEVLLRDTEGTDECYVGLGENPLVLFGIRRYTSSSAFIWAVGTPEVSRYSRRFLKGSRQVIKHWFETSNDLQILANYTHAENSEHHRWLR